MPIDKDLKRLVRARMAATSENYTTARAALVAAAPGDDLRALVSMLADPATADATAATLKARPPKLLVPALVAGLESPEWRVRRSCCRLLSTAIAWDLRRWLWAGDATAVSAGGLRWYFVMPD